MKSWINNLKIGTKLISAFVLVSLIAGLIGVIGITELKSISSSSQQMFEKQLVPITELAEISTSFQRVRVNMASLIMATTVEEKNKFHDRIKELSGIISKNVESYEKTLSSEEEKNLLGAFSETRKVYRPLLEKMSQLAIAGKTNEAYALMVGEARTAAQAEQQAIDNLEGYKVKMAQKANEKNLADARTATITTVVLIVVGMLLAIGLGVFITRSITVPLQEALGIARRVAAGDLTGTIHVDRTDEAGQLLQALKEMDENLVTIVSDVRNSSESIATATQEIAAGNNDLSRRTEEQASALEETASSMEELSSTVKQNADNAQQANQLAATASKVASKGGEVINRVVTTMDSITDSSKKISDIISVIDGIAFQTNILALNAAVEAARAGEQGRGFAVVAGEVRSLAQRSASAAKEIKTLINDSVDKVAGGSRLVEEAGQTMQEIVTSVKRVTDIMAEISAASLEQSSGIEQVATAVSQMDDVTQQNAALVEEASTAADSLEEQARGLLDVVNRFKVDAVVKNSIQSHTSSVAAVQHRSQAKVPKHATKTVKAVKKAADGYQHHPAHDIAQAPAKAVGHDEEWSEF